ncbi:DUF3179 domain-containing (seleno)protein [Halorientalis regularis]|uniref:Ferredoxin subunit of nitrite reductase or a ring-hydroxylating dioxygenase n=1 Tax=Halorientalis regularis TaxID=660518 RepID=A0A1G7R7G2_9EURY|nr:DUF3179 domain-containing (seleno)protein [Halorientalis regularis]SDG06746.1 Ferredoxin subunit of nitrite reductase or a ring-hydroxylating dioxygenase [Halorientalis regularis]
MKTTNALPKDAIASIDDPIFTTTYFRDSDDVIVLDGDPARAYPLRILSYHGVVNDTVDGRTLTFGVSGKLADDALVMDDRETDSEWRQPSGDCLAGRTLTTLPSTTTTCGEFRAAHPEGVVLEPLPGNSEGGARPSGQAYDMEPYSRYREDDEFGLYGMRGDGERRTWDRTDLDAKTLVLGITHDGDAVGYPLPQVEAAGGVVTDTVGGRDVVVVVGDGELHAFEDPGTSWTLTDGELTGDGAVWDPRTGESDDGRQLHRVPARTLFAFAWQDDHGAGAFYGPNPSSNV